MDSRAKVEALVTTWRDAWNASDMDALTALFMPDIHWVNVVGMHWQGKRAVEHAHRVFFDVMFRGVQQTLEEIESVVDLPGGAIVAVVRWWMEPFRQPDGTMKPAHHDRLTVILVPDGDALKIAHGANITVVPEAQAFDPARRLEGVA